MTGNVYANMTPISMCEAPTGWTTITTGGTITVADNTIYDPIQGTYNLQDYSASSKNRGADFDLGAGGTNLTGKAIYCWFSFNRTSILQVKGANGLRIRVTDTSGNYSEWDIAGSDTLPHAGWIPYCIELASTPSRISGTLIVSAVRYAGYRANTVASKGYIYFDAWRYGTGLTITGGNSGTPTTWADLNAADTPNPSGNTNAYGVVTYLNGIYFIQGQINIGYAAGATAESTYFKDSSQVIVFKSNTTVTDTFYRIYGQGSASYQTQIFFGSKSGTQGISGLIILSQSNSYRYTMTLTDANITNFGLYGCIFNKASTITLPANSANKEALNCNFIVCAEVIPSTTTMTNCNFISASGKALQFSSATCVNYITLCNFISCQTAIEVTVAGTFDPWTSLVNSGNTYDVEFTAAGSLVINESGTSNIDNGKINNSGGGTTTVNLNVSLTIYTKDTTGTKISGVQVEVESALNKAMAGAVQYRSGPTYTDETNAANNDTANDMHLLHSSVTENDAYYFGGKNPFKFLRLTIGTAGVWIGALTWEYWNGSTWATVTIDDVTNGFRNSGIQDLRISPPTDWAQTSVSSITCYWIRARVSSYTSMATQPLGTQAWLILQIVNGVSDETDGKVTGSFNYGWGGLTDVWIKARKSSTVPKYVPVKTFGSISSSGMNVTVSMTLDSVAE